MIKSIANRMRRYAFLMMALLLGAITFTPLFEQKVFAAGSQVSSRSIKLSTSTPGANLVTYHVQFNSQSTGNIGGIVVQFCGDSPIIGSTSCTTTTAADASVTASPSVTNQSSTVGCSITTFTTVAPLSTNTAVEISNATPVNFTTSNCLISFDITSVTNPTNTGSFYARIYTYASQANANAYTIAGGGGTYVDYGGVALSTASQVSITATVQETLTFCTSGLVASNPPADCSAPTAPAVTLGTGSPLTIDPAAVYDNSAGTYRTYMGLATNANSGASVTMKSNWTCNGLSRDNGASCGIPGSAGALTAGTAGFGLKVATGTGTTGSLSAANGYSSGTFHMGSTGSATTYGDQIASTSSAPCTIAVSQLTFGATAATTTPAGVYSTNETLIATGTF